jgi:hypothetical protein
MNRDKELNDLINRLNRIFPHLEMINEGHYFADDNSYKKMHQVDYHLMLQNQILHHQ